jgi:transcription initiation factor TFIIB
VFEQFAAPRSAGTAATAATGAVAPRSALESAIADDVRTPTQCLHCGAREVTLMAGNYECAACCTVVGRFLDYGAEWRVFSGEDSRQGADPARCGPPISELLPLLGSVISGTGRESRAMRLVQKYQVWGTMTYRERTLVSVFDKLSTSASRNGIGSCILDDSKAMYKRLSEARLSRGDNHAALIASSLFMALKTNGVPRSIKEVATMFDVKVGSMNKSCKTFQDVLKLNVQSSGPGDFVGRFCSRLGMHDGAAALTRHVVDRAGELYLLSESTPPSVVAGAVQLVNVKLALGLQKKAIADACHVSAVTIGKCHKRLEAYGECVLPDAIEPYATPPVRLCGR